MKKILMMFLFSFLVLGVTLNAPILFAHEDDNEHHSNSLITGSATNENPDDDNSGSSNTDSDNSGSDRLKTALFKERIKDRNGVIEKEVEGRFFDANGNEVRIKRKIKMKDGEFEIRTKLKVEGEGSNLFVRDSQNETHRIRVTPEKLRELMLRRLNASNVTNFSLEEIQHKNIPRVVYKVNSEHPGRFLGIFKLALKSETLVDSEGGEFLAVNTPWWAFLVTGDIPSEDDEKIVGNETLAEEVVADDDELEDEFEDVEVEEEVDDGLNDDEDESENESA